MGLESNLDNLYHSFRGDTLDDAGFGQDIRVIRRILDWLDQFPHVHGDWDIENAFSLDDRLPAFAPDIIPRIGARLAAGQDGLRIMSWNNGAVASQTREEFEGSIELAKQSYLATFGTFDPGVQPQENMFSPDHVGWYRALGIEWITLFNRLTTAFRAPSSPSPPPWAARPARSLPRASRSPRSRAPAMRRRSRGAPSAAAPAPDRCGAVRRPGTGSRPTAGSRWAAATATSWAHLPK